MFFLWILVGSIVAVVVWIAFWHLISFIVVSSRRQKEFMAGSLPDTPPDGFYRGSAYLLGGGPVPWLGKSFEKDKRRGFNIFTPRGASMLKLLTPFYGLFTKNAEGNTNAYYFATTSSQGFRDSGIETFKLDYDSPENPFLIRIILDEIVQTASDEFLGKVHLKVYPGYYATIGFFGLKK